MASYLNLDESESLKAKVDERAPDTFQLLLGRPQLEVSRHFKKINEENKETVCVVRNQDVRSVLEVKSLERESKGSSQFFIIRQERSWTTLNISRELFDDLLLNYGVFSHFWKAVFTFGRKSEENEFTFPGFRARRSFSYEVNADLYESAYVLRRAELHHRVIRDDQSPWSIRQTAVYHKLNIPSDFKQSSSTFILIAPSKKFESQLSQSLELSKIDERAIGQWNVHRLLIADSLSGWMDYMAWLEEGLREQSNFIVTAQVGAEKDRLSPLIDFNINFIDRQILKRLEDSVIDLQVILPTLLGNIVGVRELCQKWCKERHGNWVDKCDCPQIMAEMDEHIRETETFVKRAEALKVKAESTAQLLSDLLAYEDAVSLKDVAQESRKESRSMFFLTVRSTKDAIAVKVLTIISLIYLPSTIVAENFFSTQFVHTDDNGNMALAGNSWLLAAISVPLTIITIALWWAWVRYANAINPPAPELAPVVKVVRYNSFRSMRSLRKGQRPSDVEMGSGTWSSETTARSR